MYRLLLALTCLLVAPSGASADVGKDVLVLTSESSATPGLVRVMEQAVSALRATSGPVNVSVESLERSWLPDDAERELPRLRKAYAGRHLNLVIALCAPAVDFALRHRDELFRGAPILFAFVEPSMVRPASNLTGVFLDPDWPGLLNLALALHPTAHTLLVVGGTAEFDRGWQASLGRAIHAFDARITIRYLTNASLRETLGEVAVAPDDSIVLYLSTSRDADGATYVPRDVLDLIRRVSRTPIYGPSDSYLGHGVVGGRLFDLDAHGAELGRMAARVLAGESPDRIRPVTTPGRLAFDWRELQRFHVSERALPRGAAILYREPSFWTLHLGTTIAVAAPALGAMTLLVLALVAHRRKRAGLERTLAARLRFEAILSDMSAALGGAPIPRMSIAVRAALGLIRRYVGVERASIFELSADGNRAVRTEDDCAPGCPPGPDGYPLTGLPFLTLAMASLQPFVVGRLDDLPADAVRERAVLAEGRVRSMLMIPMEVGGHGLGSLSCVSYSREVTWSDELVQQVRTLGQILANVIQRRQADSIVSESDRLRGAILSSMQAHITVLDRDGTLIAVNDAWVAYGRANGIRNEAAVSPGANYLHVCERAAAAAAPGAAQALAGIRAVCEGRSESFDMEYVCPSPTVEQWFALKVVPLRRPEGGAVVTHRDVTAEKRQELALRESEQRFRLLADALPVGVWISGTDGGCTYFNREWLEFAGRPLESEIGDGWLERVHADDQEAVRREYSRAFEAREAFSIEYRLLRSDGAYRWLLDQGTPRYEAHGRFRGFVGGCVDITERIEAENRLRELSGRLITAQEEERHRIARELHDDVQQRLALLAIQLDGIALGRPLNAGSDLAATARDLWQQTIEISSGIHHLSHRLHPSKLEALGLLATVQGCCRELAQGGLQVSFTHDAVPQSVHGDVALCVFRTVQEALQNVLKHSGVNAATVSISHANGALRVVVADQGRGFDVDEAWNHAGLGLNSMRERLHLVGGTIQIRSNPGAGTSIEFEVPVPTDRVGHDGGRQTART